MPRTVTADLAHAAATDLQPTITLYDDDGDAASIDAKVGVLSISVGDFTAGDENAIVALDENPGGLSNLTPLHLHVPSTLPAGTTVTLTVNQPADSDVSVWDESGPTPQEIIQNGDDSQTWVVGEGMPEVVYADGLAPTARDFITFQLTANPAASGSQGVRAFMAADAATQPSTQPVTAKADASIPGGDFRIQKVTFDATDHSHYHPIAKDDGTGNYDGSWYDANGNGKLDEGDHFDPICYTRSNVGPVQNGPDGKPKDRDVYYKLAYTIIGKGVPGHQYAVSASEVIGATIFSMKGTATFVRNTVGEGQGKLEGVLTSVGIVGVPELPNIYKLKFNWSVTDPSGSPPPRGSANATRPSTSPSTFEAGTTSDIEYVTAADPILSNVDPHSGAHLASSMPNHDPILETIIATGCRGAASAVSMKPADVFDKIWAQFTNGVKPGTPMKTAEGKAMDYWGPSASSSEFSNGPLALCKNGSGRCGTWANFMVDVMATQGLPASFDQIRPRYCAKNLDPKPPGVLHWGLPEELIVKSAIAGQNNSNPPVSFQDHAVVVLDAAAATALGLGLPATYFSSIFDPSYGTLASGPSVVLAEVVWERQAIAAFYYECETGASLHDHREVKPDTSGASPTDLSWSI